MDLYPLLRPLLFRLPPETAHRLGLSGLALLTRLGYRQECPSSPKEVMGLTFPNPIGLAAGCDKDGDYIEALAALGFGFIEVGTVTPRPQPGNPKPRIFRLPEQQAVINRMGFPSRGLDRLVANLERLEQRRPFVLGVNVGKNRETPPEQAVEDYLEGLRRVAPFADYVTLNLSSPNTPNLRALQLGGALRRFLEAIAEAREALPRRIPLALKIAPDLEPGQLEEIARALLEFGIDAVIATNTTLSRAGLNHPLARERGGLSGRPLFERARAVVLALAERLKGKVAIIGCGGIMSGEEAASMVEAGADLIQVYTGLIFRGPALIPEIGRAILERPSGSVGTSAPEPSRPRRPSRPATLR